jgi:hypothetical protein
VRDASAVGHDIGTTQGGSVRTLVATYHICFNANVSAGFKGAIRVNVHVISASVGGDTYNYLGDVVTIGSLHAVKANMTVVCYNRERNRNLQRRMSASPPHPAATSPPRQELGLTTP